MFRIPFSILGTHLRRAAQSASGQAQTVTAPVTHRRGMFSRVRPLPAKARPMPVRPARTSVPGFRGGLFRRAGLLAAIRPILMRKIAEGKPYAMAIEEARREAEYGNGA